VSQTLNTHQSLDWQLDAKEGTNQRPYTYSRCLPELPPQQFRRHGQGLRRLGALEL
jgi:hypothetical protein